MNKFVILILCMLIYAGCDKNSYTGELTQLPETNEQIIECTINTEVVYLGKGKKKYPHISIPTTCGTKMDMICIIKDVE